MFFRFGSALVLIVLISLAGVAVEKRNLELRRRVIHQHFQTDVLRDVHARLRLETEQLGAPVRMLDSIESGELAVRQPEQTVDTSPRRVPLLEWRRAIPTNQPTAAPSQ